MYLQIILSIFFHISLYTLFSTDYWFVALSVVHFIQKPPSVDRKDVV
jgi:hypothetical protein